MNRSTIEAKIQELYIGMLGRAADAAGLKYWADEIETGTMILENTRAAFTQQVEYTSIYAGLSSSQLVTSVYQNLLERNPDQGGLNYWVSELDAGKVSPDQFVVAVVNAAQDSSATALQTLIDAQVLANKVNAASYFTSQAAGMTYDAVFSAIAKTVVSSVDDTIASILASQQTTNNALPSLTPITVTGPTVLSSSGTFALDFIKGTDLSDSITLSNTSGVPVAMGLDGNDTIWSTGALSLLLGGDGDDTYHLGNSGSYIIVDSSGSDHIYIPTAFNEFHAATVNNGKDLLVFNDSMGVLLLGWQDPNQRIETFTLNDGTYSYNYLVNAVAFFSEGDFSDSYAEQWLEIPFGTLDPHILLSEYLGDINSGNYDSVIDFDTSSLVGSEALIDYLL